MESIVLCSLLIYMCKLLTGKELFIQGFCCDNALMLDENKVNLLWYRVDK